MTDAPKREAAYQRYINEITPNGNTRIDNIVLCAGQNEDHHRHIATQVHLAFQAGWSARADLAKPKVKPLVWEKQDFPGEYFVAQSIFGQYCCAVDFDGVAYGCPSPNPKEWSDFPALEAAKAAAQADYERRILEALE